MKQLILAAFIGLWTVPAFSQPAKREIHKGNELYQQKKYADAAAFYKQSVDKSKESLEGNFNLGDAWYKQKKYDDAIGKFTDIASNAPDKGVKAQAYHNLGNALLSSNKLEESIAAYKKSLMNNPKDEETRYNLAYAQEKLKQQQQNKDNKDNKDKKNNKDQQNKDQQNKDNKDQQNKDNKDQQNKDNKDQQNKDQNKDPDKNNPDKDQQNQQPKPDQLSKDDAERLLEALNQEEKKTQDKLKDKKAKGVKGRIEKQW